MGGGSQPYLGPITLNNPWSILKKKNRHWHFTFTRFSTMDQKKNVFWLDDCLIALKFSKNAPISKLFSFLSFRYGVTFYAFTPGMSPSPRGVAGPPAGQPRRHRTATLKNASQVRDAAGQCPFLFWMRDYLQKIIHSPCLHQTHKKSW